MLQSPSRHNVQLTLLFIAPVRISDDSFEMEQLEVTGAITGAARAIAAAVSSLVKIATVLQREIMERDKNSTGNKKLNQFYRKDTIFSEGLISAAKMVATTTTQLVKNANSAAMGQLQEENL